MKVLLLTGGVLFLLLAFFLFAAAAIAYFVGRNRRTAAPLPRPVTPPQPGTPYATPAQSGGPATQGIPPHVQVVVPVSEAVLAAHEETPLRGSAPPPPPPPPIEVAPPAASDPDGTVVVDSRRQQAIGALHGISGALAGRILPVFADGFYIGRDHSLAQVVVENPSVSKRHVWIGVRDGAAVAVDQNSTNGTYLNGGSTRITEVKLNPGDTLTISDDVTRLIYRL